MELLQFWLAVLAVTALFEGVTCLFRFGFGLKAREDLSWMRRWTRGFRVHHGYPGIAIVGLSLTDFLSSPVLSAILVVGWGLLLSDALHHFVVLPLTVGRTEFDLRFPAPPADAEAMPAVEAAE